MSIMRGKTGLMNNRFVINYVPGNTLLQRLNGATKVMWFIVITVYVIMTFDIRVMIPMFILCTAGIISMKPNWKPIIVMLGFMFVMQGLIGSLLIILVRPSSGYNHVGMDTEIIRWTEHFYLSKELLWYVGAMFFKRLCSFSTAMIFVLSITPSELAAGLNKIGLPYKVCTIVSLAFRTIPDIARDYNDIRNSMMMRGIELDTKRVSLVRRIKQMIMMLVPLILTSFGKVNNIANAMDLRGYGKYKKRSYYSEHPATGADKTARVLLLIVIGFVIYYIVFQRILNPSEFDYWCPWVVG